MIGAPVISCPFSEFTFFQHTTRSIDFGSLFFAGRAARTIHAFLGCSAAFLTILLAKHVFAHEACLYRKLVRIILLIFGNQNTYGEISESPSRIAKMLRDSSFLMCSRPPRRPPDSIKANSRFFRGFDDVGFERL